jgi:hypothetical protein
MDTGELSAQGTREDELPMQHTVMAERDVVIVTMLLPPITDPVVLEGIDPSVVKTGKAKGRSGQRMLIDTFR